MLATNPKYNATCVNKYKEKKTPHRCILFMVRLINRQVEFLAGYFGFVESKKNYCRNELTMNVTPFQF